MVNETFSLSAGSAITLTTYVLDKALDGTLRPLVIVCPGGAFLGCSPSEGEPVALHYNRLGFDAAVLTYTTAQTAPGVDAYPQALRDLAEAVLIVRDHAQGWGVDPPQDRGVGLLGRRVCGRNVLVHVERGASCRPRGA